MTYFKFGKIVPEFVFSGSHSAYWFFDADLCSSQAAWSDLRQVHDAFNQVAPVEVLAASDGGLLGYLQAGDDWNTRLKSLARRMNADGDYGGIALKSMDENWSVYQSRPVDLGVFAVNEAIGAASLPPTWRDTFFDASDIGGWLEGTTERDVAIVQTYGRDYLRALLDNYPAR